MKKYKSTEMIAAHESGEYRERFAMENGNKTTIYI